VLTGFAANASRAEALTGNKLALPGKPDIGPLITVPDRLSTVRGLIIYLSSITVLSQIYFGQPGDREIAPAASPF